MAELRKDPITGRWVIVAPEAPLTPKDFEPEPRTEPKGICPFCPGNEAMTPPQIAVRCPPGKPWRNRVVPNKFPALRIEGGLERIGVGIYDRMNGIGAHEVIIETPEHLKELADFTPEEFLELLQLFQERSLDLAKDKRFRYILIFKNFGEAAGASLSHPHSQLIALPIVPKRVKEEMATVQHYYAQKERCIFCDLVYQEVKDRERLFLEGDEVAAFAPFSSLFPFELWVAPKKHAAHFTSAPAPVLQDLARVLPQIFKRMRDVLRGPSYNFVLLTSALEDRNEEAYHWHIEIMPRLTRVAGFEWGSGFYVNPTPPELACRYLRGELTA
ncbi:MAG: galactose-1-phosphate uridylyltransferase [Candidatus Omnitrophica bacterium]|nr:galactose-1-phosphate uridylyltransferase [Candidatus Omnitrophota bacterium]